MSWVGELPTEPGYYWVRYRADPQLVQVYARDGDSALWVRCVAVPRHFDHNPLDSADYWRGTTWRGPVAFEPAEPYQPARITMGADGTVAITAPPSGEPLLDLIDRVCNDVWNELAPDPQWGGAHGAAVTTVRERLRKAVRALPRPA